MKILAIETSCDETSVAIIETSGPRRRPTVRVRAHFISSQIALHKQFGGVVPNLAKREHQRLLVPLLMKALKKSSSKADPPPAEKIKTTSQEEIEKILDREPILLAQFKKKILPLAVPDIDAIAVTNGPGLAPALWVGINFAKALAYVWKKSIIPVNHMKGHLFSALLQCGKENVKCSAKGGSASGGQIPHVKFPLIALLVSGGHTELVLMKAFGNYKIIGETLDDAAGEAFDKVARMLGLGYPGGPAIAAVAIQEQISDAKNEIIWPNQKHVIARSSSDEAISTSGNGLLRSARNDTMRDASSQDGSKSNIKFPRPMIGSNDFNFSFSGLKTSVLYFIRDLADEKSVRAYTPAIAKEFQDAVIDVLVAKTMRAARQYKAKTIVVGGGVSANKQLRKTLKKEISEKLPEADYWMPEAALAGDNALMIALAATIDGRKKAPIEIGAEANMRL